MQLGDVWSECVSRIGAAKQQIRCYVPGCVPWTSVCGLVRQFGSRLRRDCIGWVISECDISEQRCPVQLDQLCAISRACRSWRWRDHDLTDLIVGTWGVA